MDKNLTDPKWKRFRAAVAFVKHSGVELIETQLAEFAKRAKVKMSVGISFKGTSLEGLTLLHETLKGKGEIWVYHNGNGSTFHPKVFLFANDTEATVVIGSGNLTRGGLFTNYEGGFALDLDLSQAADKQLLKEVEDVLDAWTDPAEQLARKLDDALLTKLATDGWVPPEVYTREAEEGTTPTSGVTEEVEAEEEPPLFATVAVPGPPRRTRPARPAPSRVATTAATSGPNVFYMTLHQTDVGRGQVTKGKKRRSPEVFIPLIARDAAPAFWDWPTAFVPDPRNKKKMDRKGVQMMIGTRIETVNMMTWPKKHDFRLRSEVLRSSGRIGDVMRIERTDGSAGYLYHVTVIPQGSTDYPAARAECRNTVRNSAKEWGYR